MKKPYYQDEWVTIYLGDCREILPELPKVDLVLADPPYGIYDPRIKYTRTNKWKEMYKNDEPFNPTFLLPLGNLILWGANCYASRLPDSKTWLAWIKTYTDGRKGQGGDVDFAWTNCVGRSRSFYYLWAGYYRDGEVGRYLHPTQKPEALIEWCLSLVPNANLILDPFLGSGTTAYCAKKLNRKCIGIEIEERYCEISAKRCSQMVLDLTSTIPSVGTDKTFGKAEGQPTLLDKE